METTNIVEYPIRKKTEAKWFRYALSAEILRQKSSGWEHCNIRYVSRIGIAVYSENLLPRETQCRVYFRVFSNASLSPIQAIAHVATCHLVGEVDTFLAYLHFDQMPEECDQQFTAFLRSHFHYREKIQRSVATAANVA